MLGFLERQRATFEWKAGSLDSASLRARLAPSSMTLGGLLKHLARFEDDMSTEWLHGRSQLPPWNAVDWQANPDWDWDSAAEETPAQLYGRWRAAVARSRALFAEAMADAGPGRQGTIASRPDIELPSLRYILLNMIEEYARHNGHADLIRESVDGLAGQDPPRQEPP
nr:DinB family protein [Paenarthrobacter aurescens]